MEEKDKFLMHPKKFEALEKRVETLEKKHQDLIDNLRIGRGICHEKDIQSKD